MGPVSGVVCVGASRRRLLLCPLLVRLGRILFLFVRARARLIRGFAGRCRRRSLARKDGAALDAELGGNRVAIPAMWTFRSRHRRSGLQIKTSCAKAENSRVSTRLLAVNCNYFALFTISRRLIKRTASAPPSSTPRIAAITGQVSSQSTRSTTGSGAIS